MDLDVLCLDGLASGDDPAEESSDSSYRRMDGPVCHGPGGVSVCFQDECGGPDPPCLRSIPLVFFAGGRLPMHTPWLSLSQIQRECLPCLLPVVSSRPFFWGRSPLM